MPCFRSALHLVLHLFQGYHDLKAGTLARNAGSLDDAPVAGDNLSGDGQSDTCSFVFVPGMQPLEDREDLLRIDIIKADPVILDTDAAVMPTGVGFAVKG